MVRPEEIEVAATRAALRCGFLAHGTVEGVMFTGALERLRLKVDKQAQPSLLTLGESNGNGTGNGSVALQVTRTQHEQRLFEVQPGQGVAIGVRRVHVLPTPLSSFTACAATAQAAEALSHQPLLVELASRMKTRITTRTEPQLGQPDAPCQGTDTFVGTTVIAASAASAAHAEWLLRRGARDLLVLPPDARAPQRVLIHWSGEAARSATLAVSASMLRHVPAEAVYVGVVPGPEGAAQPQGMRELLDARSEAQAAHGLEMRTELHFGDAEQHLARRLAESSAQMLIIGVSRLGDFSARFAALLAGGRWPVLVVHRGTP